MIRSATITERQRLARVVTDDKRGSVVMVTYREMAVQEICEDASLSTDEKIEKLREIETEARGPAEGSVGKRHELR